VPAAAGARVPVGRRRNDRQAPHGREPVCAAAPRRRHGDVQARSRARCGARRSLPRAPSRRRVVRDNVRASRREEPRRARRADRLVPLRGSRRAAPPQPEPFNVASILERERAFLGQSKLLTSSSSPLKSCSKMDSSCLFVSGRRVPPRPGKAWFSGVPTPLVRDFVAPEEQRPKCNSEQLFRAGDHFADMTSRSRMSSGSGPFRNTASWNAFRSNFAPSAAVRFFRSSLIFSSPILYASACPGHAT